MEKSSIRHLMVLGGGLLGLGFMAASRAQSMQQLLVIYFIFMASAAVLMGPIAGSALLARWFTKRRGLAMSLSAAGAAVGGLIAPPLLQWLIDAYTWRQALLVYGIGVLVITLPVAWFLVINRPTDINQYPDGADEAPTQAQSASEDLGWGFYLRDRNFWLLSIVLGVLFGSSMGITKNLIQYAGEMGIDAQRAALLLSIYSASNFVGKLGTGALADKINPRLLLGAVIVLFTLAVLSFTQFTTYTMLISACVVFGISQGGIVPLWSVLIARLYGPDRVGRSMGMMSLLLTPFNLVAAPFFGAVADRTGSYQGAFLVATALLIFATVLLGLIRERPES
jgi:sugar phosphate permease